MKKLILFLIIGTIVSSCYFQKGFFKDDKTLERHKYYSPIVFDTLIKTTRGYKRADALIFMCNICYQRDTFYLYK